MISITIAPDDMHVPTNMTHTLAHTHFPHLNAATLTTATTRAIWCKMKHPVGTMLTKRPSTLCMPCTDKWNASHTHTIVLILHLHKRNAETSKQLHGQTLSWDERKNTLLARLQALTWHLCKVAHTRSFIAIIFCHQGSEPTCNEYLRLLIILESYTKPFSLWLSWEHHASCSTNSCHPNRKLKWTIAPERPAHFRRQIFTVTNKSTCFRKRPVRGSKLNAKC